MRSPIRVMIPFRAWIFWVPYSGACWFSLAYIRWLETLLVSRIRLSLSSHLALPFSPLHSRFLLRSSKPSFTSTRLFLTRPNFPVFPLLLFHYLHHALFPSPFFHPHCYGLDHWPYPVDRFNSGPSEVTEGGCARRRLWSSRRLSGSSCFQGI